MKRVFLISVALSTFLCGCVLARLSTTYSGPASVTVNNPPSGIVTSRERKSLLDGIAPTIRACGDGYGQGYELPDGKKLGEGNSCFLSFRAAKREMAVWLDKSESIIDRTAPSKQRGEPRSERVVASFPADEFGNRWVTVMWVRGRCIHYVNGPDLEHALELEESDYNPYKFEE